MKYLFYICFLGLGLQACRFPNPQAGNAEANRFFDVSDYFKAEITRLKAEKRELHKTATLGQKTEEQQTAIKSWEEELAFFIQSDINKPVLWEKYKVDSLKDEQNQLAEIRYEALDTELRTRKLDVKFKNNVVHSILIVNYVHNYLYNTQEFLEYIPTQGYTVTKKQDVALYDENFYKIDARF